MDGSHEEKTETGRGKSFSKRVRIVSVAILAAVAGFLVMPAHGDPVGTGTTKDPYQIATPEDLAWLSLHYDKWSYEFVMKADIDASASTTAITPIGNATTQFTGKFHGAGHRVTNFRLVSAEDYAGLFGYVSYPGVIDSLGLTNSKVTGKKGTGSLAGICNGGLVNYCFAIDDTVSGTGQCVGGLIGWLECNTICGTATGCFATGAVTSSSQDVGGLVGWQNGYIFDSYARVSVFGQIAHGTGGLVGFIIGGSVNRCYSTGQVTGPGSGGLVGAGGSAVNCFWDSVTSGKTTSGGGTGKSTAEMTTQSTFTNATWDFAGETVNGTADIWVMNGSVNNGYPCFAWMTKPVVATAGNVKGAIDSACLIDTVVCYGKLKSLSLAAPTAHGFCWNTAGVPTTADHTINLGAASKADTFSARITGLSDSGRTSYYVRAYATNALGTSYGDPICFIRGVMSYHWQPSESFQPVCGAGNIGDVTFLKPVNTGTFTVLDKDTSARWLDKAADGNRYVFDLNGCGGISYGYQFKADLNFSNHTFYVVAKNTVPTLEVVLQRTATTFNKVTFKYLNDTIYSAIFDRNIWTATPVSLKKIKTSGSWIPYYVHMKNVSDNSLRVSFGCANQEMASVTVTDSTNTGPWNAGSAYCWANSDSTAGLIADVHAFGSYDSAGVANIWPVFFSPSYKDNGPLIRVPTLIHNIIYDPPGSESFSTCTFDTSTETDLNFNWSANAGASLEVGTKGSIEFGVAIGVDVSTGVELSNTTKAEVHYKYEHNVGYEVGLSKSTSTSSMVENADPAFIGPTFGDVVVYQSLAYRTVIMRRPVMSKFLSATAPTDFVYAAAGGVPVPDSCSPAYYTPIRTMIHDLQNDTAGLSFLQREYPYDLKTGKVLQSALDSAWDPITNTKNPPRLQKLPGEGEKVIGGNITYHNSSSREDIQKADSTHSWGASIEFNYAVWSLEMGFELNIGGGCDFALSKGVSNGQNSTIEYTFQDNDSWDVFRITPYMDNRFKTVCFLIDSANSYTSFPHEANTRPAVTWQTSSVPACTGFVGNATVVQVTVKNTSPRNILSALPEAFAFGISAINFPGTFTVTPENVEIGVGQTQTFTCTFTGASTGAFQQQLRITCYHPVTNWITMDESITFPMTMKNGNVGLVVSNPQDTFTLAKGATVSHVFNVKMINVGIQADSVIFGTDSASAGATIAYGSFANPVGAGDSASLSITVKGDAAHNYFTVRYWAQIQGDTMTKSLHMLVLRTQDSVGVIARPSANIIRELGLRNLGSSRLELLVPANEAPTLRLYSFSGRMLYSQNPRPGRTILDMHTMHLSNGFYILRLQGKKVLQQKILVSGKR